MGFFYRNHCPVEIYQQTCCCLYSYLVYQLMKFLPDYKFALIWILYFVFSHVYPNVAIQKLIYTWGRELMHLI